MPLVPRHDVPFAQTAFGRHCRRRAGTCSWATTTKCPILYVVVVFLNLVGSSTTLGRRPSWEAAVSQSARR